MSSDLHSSEAATPAPASPGPAGHGPLSAGPLIRTASPDEAPRILGLWQRAGAAPTRTDDTDSIAAIAATGAVLVAVGQSGVDPPGADPSGADPSGKGDRIVGTLIAAWDGWRGNLYRLAVDPDHRRNGIALALVRAGEAHLRALGCVRISALVLDDEHDATGFWRSAGYELQPEISRWTSTIPDTIPDTTPPDAAPPG